MRSVSRNSLFFFIFLFAAQIAAQDTLHSRVHISILTCAPGQELYSLYGHNAIRVADGSSGSDLVYHYGTFDFDTPNFALKFMRGRLPYLISVSTYADFLREYVYYQRAVIEQELMLTAAEKGVVIAYLDRNMLPENRAYKYDFFHDNCATRLRDIINRALPGLAWQAVAPQGKTYRQIIKEYQLTWPWTDFGIDLIIGASADQITNVEAQAFIPDYLAKALTEVNRPGNPGERLQYNRRQILDFPQVASTKLAITGPVAFFSLLLALELLLLGGVGQRLTRLVFWYDRIWYVVLCATSMLMTFMWVGTDHLATKHNWNLLWANPVIVFWSWVNKSGVEVKKIVFWVAGLVCLVCLVNALPACNFLPQYFHPAIAPLCGVLILKMVRSYQN